MICPPTKGYLWPSKRLYQIRTVRGRPGTFAIHVAILAPRDAGHFCTNHTNLGSIHYIRERVRLLRRVGACRWEDQR